MSAFEGIASSPTSAQDRGSATVSTVDEPRRDLLEEILHIASLAAAARGGGAFLVSMADLLSKVEKRGDYQSTFLSLRGVDAQGVLDAIQAWLDLLRETERSGESQYRLGIYFLVRLARQSGELPPSLFLSGVDIGGVRDPIAIGAFADIFRGTLQGKQVALKRLRIIVSQRNPLHKTFYKEALVWKQLHHPYVLPFLGVDKDTFGSTELTCMVSPWLKRGALHNYLESPSYDFRLRDKLLREIAEGLAYLHALKIVHGDLHGGNVFINDDGSACIADFGIVIVGENSAAKMTTATTQAGAARWMPPERLDPRTQNQRMQSTGDVWAFGCLIIFIYTHKRPYDKIENDMTVMIHIFSGGQPERPMDNECKGSPMSGSIWTIAQQCWARNPCERPEMKTIHERLTTVGLRLHDLEVEPSLSPTAVQMSSLTVTRGIENTFPEQAANQFESTPFFLRPSEKPIVVLNEAENPRFLLQSNEHANQLGPVADNTRPSLESTPTSQAVVLESHMAHHDRAVHLNKLALSLHGRFNSSGDLSSLVEAIGIYREAVQLMPGANRNRPNILGNLSSALHSYFEQSGDISVLTESIELLREALNVVPVGHPLRPNLLGYLAQSLHTYFEQLGDPSALNEAIKLLREALLLQPMGNTLRPGTMNRLASSLHTLFQQTGDIDALEESIQLLRGALEIQPIGHTLRPNFMSNLASSLHSKFERTADGASLEQSIQLLRDALDLQPTGHSGRAGTLYNLSNVHLSQYMETADDKVLANVLSLAHDSLEQRPEGHPERHTIHTAIANVWLLESPLFNWNVGLVHISEAISDGNAPPRSRLRHAISSLKRVEEVTSRNPAKYLPSKVVLDLYIVAVRLLPRVAHLGLDSNARLRELSGSEELCRAAAMRAVLLDQPSTAFELFEEGKGVFWQQALHVHSLMFKDLPPEDSTKLVNIFRALENKPGDANDRSEMERHIQIRLALNREAERFIEEIRLRPGFDRFLMIPDFGQLLNVIGNIPVIMLIESQRGCIAVIAYTLWPELVRTVELPRITPDGLGDLVERASWYNLRGHYRGSQKDEDHPRGFAITGRGKSALSEIWTLIAAPIIEKLGFPRANGRLRPRVYWYPSGRFTFLPLHAAGIYKGDEKVCISDYVVSSYAPSLSAIIRARQNAIPILRANLRALVISGSNAPGLPQIIGADEEVETVAGILSSVSATVINDIGITPIVSSVVEKLPEAHFLHFSCHGQQRPDPLESSFSLEDGHLTIASLMNLSLPNATLAFLSACETATGSKDQPDQAVHLAASMLFCGCRSVVATMWAMYDIDGPLIAQWFYEALLEKEVIDLDDVPYALDEAIQRLRNTEVGPIRWATFMHMGA